INSGCLIETCPKNYILRQDLILWSRTGLRFDDRPARFWVVWTYVTVYVKYQFEMRQVYLKNPDISFYELNSKCIIGTETRRRNPVNRFCCAGFVMEQSRAKPEVVMYAGRGWSQLIPFLHFARTLSVYHGFRVLLITHDKYTPGIMEYIQQVAFSCNDVITVVPAMTAKRDQIASYLNLFPDCGYPLCAYIVDSMWTKSPEAASYHLKMASGMGIPTYIFFAHSVSFLCLALLKEKLYQGDLGMDGVPGLSSIAASDLPRALLADASPAEQIPRSSALVGAHGLIINSWYELESAQIDALRSEMALPPIYPIGPLMPSWHMLPEWDQEPATGAAA
ncbi:hypothetical protein KI387_032746, partial [Taxus chinensis]